MSQQVDEALVVRDVNALVGSNYYKPLLNGMKFETDEEGRLKNVPREDLRALVGDLKKYAQAEDWWLGDTGNAILALYGEEEFVWFCEEIGKDPTYVKKKVSVSRRFGAPHEKKDKAGAVTIMPDRISELRHPELSQSHHDIVQGLKDDGQRMKLLNEAAEAKMSTAQFFKHVQAWKAGPGASDEDAAAGDSSLEYGAFKAKYRAYDPKTDNPEQYLQSFIEHVTTVEFPEYIDPARRKEREERERREELADKLPSDLKAKVLLEHGSLEMPKFEAVVKMLITQNEDRAKLEKDIAKIKDEKIRTETTEKIKSENLSLEAAKEVIRKAKEQVKALGRDQDKIEKLIAKIENPEKRSEIYTLVAEQRLLFNQVEEMVKPILADELVEKEAVRIRREADNRIQKRADAIREKQLAPKEAKPKADKSELPLGKKSASPKKKASKKSDQPTA
jgi:hypothetical protein